MRSIASIAAEIRADWKNINYAAKPYLEAMACVDRACDKYGADSAATVVTYFLANASTWRGPRAKRIKAELRDMLKCFHEGY